MSSPTPSSPGDALPAPTSAQGSGAPSFFERERERLVAEIAEGLGTMIDHSNALNRKLEESISVGREFEPIAGLWGRFADVMGAAGVPDLSSAPARAAAGADGDEEQQDNGGLNRSRGAADGLPPGVAPGGGLVYGRDA